MFDTVDEASTVWIHRRRDSGDTGMRSTNKLDLLHIVLSNTMLMLETKLSLLQKKHICRAQECIVSVLLSDRTSV